MSGSERIEKRIRELNESSEVVKGEVSFQVVVVGGG